MLNWNIFASSPEANISIMDAGFVPTYCGPPGRSSLGRNLMIFIGTPFLQGQENLAGHENPGHVQSGYWTFIR